MRFILQKICNIHIHSDLSRLNKMALLLRHRSFKNNGNDFETNQNKRPKHTPEVKVSIDDPPTTCCMSGCSNCVFIIWAEALSKQMASADPIIAKKILEQVEDPGMQAFLRMELRNLGLLK